MASAKKPKVSVLMPYYDDGSEMARGHFSKAVQSVLAQTLRDFELIIAVSGKTDFAMSAARRDRRIRVIPFAQKVFPNKSRPLEERVAGIVAAWTKVIAAASGEYAALHGADDISEKNRLKVEADFLDAHPEFGAVGSSMVMIDTTGGKIGRREALGSDRQIRAHILQFNPMPSPTMMVRLALLREVGGFRKGEFAEDFDLVVRLAKKSKLCSLDEPLVRYRIHPGGGASIYKFQLYLAAMSVKVRAARELGMVPTPKDIAVNILQFISLLFPEGMRRTTLERLRGKIVMGK